MFMQNAARFSHDTATPMLGLAPLTGLTSGTLVETAQGWREAESLRIGMGVHTLDGGLRPVLALDRQTLGAGTAVVRLPGGSFDNCTTLDLLADQDLVMDHPDGHLVRIAARMLVGQRGATMVRLAEDSDRLAPLFAEDEVIWTNSGTRLYCTGIAADRTGGFIDRCEGADVLALLADLAADIAA
jgi:Hint domain